MSAADAFAQLLNEVPSGFPSVEQTLGPGNAGGAWSYTWSSVPVRVKGDNGAIYTVEYRVVETKVGGEEATFDPANDVARQRDQRLAGRIEQHAHYEHPRCHGADSSENVGRQRQRVGRCV